MGYLNKSLAESLMSMIQPAVPDAKPRGAPYYARYDIYLQEQQ